jgi:glycosyltransferase involved in cell wall biosynthesis
MARIVFLGNFRVDFTTETHHANTLESMGHTVERLQETEVRSELILEKARNSDLFIWVHTHGWNTRGRITMDVVLRNLRASKIPTMTYHLDLWFGLSRQKDLGRDPVYKHIQHFFTVDSRMADWFNTHTNVEGHYLPAAVYDKEAYYEPAELTNEVIFVGSKTYHPEWQYRPKLINWLESTYKDRFKLYGREGLGVVRGDALNKVYASTKIVVGDTLCPNFNYPSYWSDRVYETIGRGGFIIHPYIEGMEKEFTDKENIVFYEYNNFEQLQDLIEYYLKNDKEREAIRLAGHKLVKEKYTYKNRWESILKDLGIN